MSQTHYEYLLPQFGKDSEQDDDQGGLARTWDPKNEVIILGKDAVEASGDIDTEETD